MSNEVVVGARWVADAGAPGGRFEEAWAGTDGEIGGRPR